MAPTPTPTKDSTVREVQVTPNTAQIQVGGTQTFIANVIGGPDLTNRNVTWTSSNTAVATVSAAGVATAVAAGQTTIIAASAANPNVRGAAVLTVSAVTPASLSFFQVQNNTGQPAQLNNASGQLNIIANVDPGQSGLRSVQLLGTGCVTGAASDTNVVISSATISGTTGTQTQQQVTLPFATNQLTAAGLANYTNGTCVLSIRGLNAANQVVAGTTVTGPTVTLNNADVISGTIAGSKPNQADAVGLAWTGGNVTVSVTPTTYVRGRTVAGGQVVLSNGSTAALTAGTNGAFTASFDTLDATGAALIGLTAPALTATVTTVDNTGNARTSTLFTPATATLPVGSQVAASIRYDDQAPSAVTAFNFTTVNPQYAGGAGFIGSYTPPTNPAVASAAAATPGPVTLGANTQADFGGVDRVALTYQYSADGGTTWTTFTSTSQIPATANNAAYSLRIRACDALGNCSTSAALPGTFGVDFVTPVAVSSSSGAPGSAEVAPAAASLTGAGNFQVVVTDTGVTAGFAANPVTASATRIVPSGAGQTTECVNLTTGATVAANANGSCPTYQLPLNFVLPTQQGEYSLTYTVTDRAGNTSAPVTATFGIDPTAPTVSGVALPTTWFPGATFTAAAADLFEVVAGNSVVNYGAGPAIGAIASATPSGVFDATLVRTSTLSSSQNPFYRMIQTVANANAAAGGVVATSVDMRAWDLANNVSAPASAAITAGTDFTAATPFGFVQPVTFGVNLVTSPASANVCNRTGSCSGSRTATLTATLNMGAAATADVNPFTRVCFYYTQTAAGAAGTAGGPNFIPAGALVLAGCTSTATSTETGGNRTITYTLPGFDPAANLGTAGTITIEAIAIDDLTNRGVRAATTQTLGISGT